MKLFMSSVALAVGILVSHSAQSITIRYALIVGNNTGVDTDGSQPFDPLKHAEREATLLKKNLVGLSNFDPSNQRTRLIVGATRGEVKAAIRALTHQKKLDEKAFGRIDSLFLFYFTGHGLDGRLLLRDGALSADEVGGLFSEFNADFSIGVFDACYAGGLDTAALASKGIRSAPGLNLFRELPEEVLSAEGSVWYVSSSREQESYEDLRLGGVFTHFFIEALQRANADGPGITLDSIWQYARAHTVEYTAQRKRIQVPEQFIDKLRSSAPVYFSFPMARSATLVLSEALEGRFALAYAEGNLTEVFDKKRGTEQKLAVYPGDARVILVDDRNGILMKAVLLKPKTTLVLSTMQESDPSPSVGERSEFLFEKGIDLKTRVAATRIAPGLSVLGGFGYSFDMSNELLLYTRHGFLLPLRFDIGQAIVGVNFQYGYDRRQFPAWTHSVYGYGAKLAGGYAVDISLFRIAAAAAFRFAYLKMEYGTGEQRDGWQYRPSFEISLLYPRNNSIQGELFADIGPVSTPGVGQASDNIWRFSATVGLSMYFRVY